MTNERPHYFANKYSKVYIGALNTYSHDWCTLNMILNISVLYTCAMQGRYGCCKIRHIR